MVGRAIWGMLKAEGYTNLVGMTSQELDLKNQAAVERFFRKEQPQIVVDTGLQGQGGILANNTYPYQFLMDNMLIQNNLIHGAFEA
ncbi:MAG: NAD-dependent epimerase/dehydratase family protein [Flavobacteriales bacterium]|nr:NAD-dependent epimerase/dehydratase family protein [Flavobacteriales bacterium]